MPTIPSFLTRKLAGGALAVLTLGGALALSAAPASAAPRHHGYHHHHQHGAYAHWARPHRCWVAPRRVMDRFGRVHVRHVRVCR